MYNTVYLFFHLIFISIFILITNVSALDYTKIEHHPESFTQGLFYHRGFLYESTGLYGKSSLRKINATTGSIENSVQIPAEYFAEGICLVDNYIYMLTWKKNKVFVFDIDTFEIIKTFRFPHEGWGITYDGKHIYVSDGTNSIYKIDKDTFSIIDSFNVTLDNEPLNRINELEFIDGALWANIWHENFVVIISLDDFNVRDKIDLSNLSTNESKQSNEAVLNGIAFSQESKSIFFHW